MPFRPHYPPAFRLQPTAILPDPYHYTLPLNNAVENFTLLLRGSSLSGSTNRPVFILLSDSDPCH